MYFFNPWRSTALFVRAAMLFNKYVGRQSYLVLLFTAPPPETRYLLVVVVVVVTVYTGCTVQATVPQYSTVLYRHNVHLAVMCALLSL